EGQTGVGVRSLSSEGGDHLRQHRAGSVRGLAIELVEGLLLAVVAVATAWSGYQSTLWDSRSAASYGQSSKLRIQSQGAQATAGQETLYDSSTFYAWLTAAEANKPTLT